MARIGVLDPNWIQMSQEDIQNHPAWYRDISGSESEDLLQDQSPFTYLLRSGDEKYSYFISFVKQNGSIKHQFFVLELDREGWCYLNDTIDNFPSELISENLDELIPAMMHCYPDSCRPLSQ